MHESLFNPKTCIAPGNCVYSCINKCLSIGEQPSVSVSQDTSESGLQLLSISRKYGVLESDSYSHTLYFVCCSVYNFWSDYFVSCKRYINGLPFLRIFHAVIISIPVSMQELSTGTCCGSIGLVLWTHVQWILVSFSGSCMYGIQFDKLMLIMH